MPRPRRAVTLSPAASLTRAIVEDALGGDKRARRRLAATLEPLIRKTVRHGLRKFGQVHWRSTHVDVDDLVQDMFMHLFTRDAKVLRVWEPERGTAFLRVVIERRLISILRNPRTNPSRLLPVEDDILAFLQGGTSDGASRVAAAHTLRRVFARLRERLTPLGWRLFTAIYVEQLSTSAVATRFDKKPNAIHQWRRRLRLECQEVLAELEREQKAVA